MCTPKHPDPESAVDMEFRPAHYSDFQGPMEAMVNGIAGQMRRDATRSRLSDDGVEMVYHFFHAADGPPPLEEKADEGYVRAMNRFHGPHWLGGEYLPDLKVSEVEIARIVLASVLCDVISIRARWVGGRYHYRVLDEYETVISLGRKSSKRTLTLRQLIELIQSAEGFETQPRGCGIMELWWERQWDNGEPPTRCTSSARIESEIYLELPSYYQLKARAWEAGR